MADEFVRVLLTQSWVEGELVKGRLEAEGVPVHLEGDHEGPYPVGPVELFVPPRYEAQARSILAQVESGTYELTNEDESGSVPKHEQPE